MNYEIMFWGSVIVNILFFIFWLWRGLKTPRKDGISKLLEEEQEDDEYMLSDLDNGEMEGIGDMGDMKDMGDGKGVKAEPRGKTEERTSGDLWLFALRIKLEDANMIIPEMDFTANDDLMTIRVKQEVLKVKKVLRELLGGMS